MHLYLFTGLITLSLGRIGMVFKDYIKLLLKTHTHFSPESRAVGTGVGCIVETLGSLCQAEVNP